MADNFSIHEKTIGKTFKRSEWAGFTKYAAMRGYVIKNSPGECYFSHMRTGRYVAYGKDINGRSFKREYVVDQSDLHSPWAIWRDYNGRWGLKTLWHETENGMRMIHEKGGEYK